MQNNQYSLVLNFDGDYRYADEDAPSRFVFESSGKLLLRDDDESKVEIGIFSASVIDVQGAIVEGESVLDVFDSSENTVGYFEELYDFESCDPNPRVMKAAYGDEYPWNANLLILDRMIVYPDHRGHGFGLLALRALIHRLRTGVGLIAMKPFPLQYEAQFLNGKDAAKSKRLGLNQFDLPEIKATAKLKRYYQRLGFKVVPRTKYMVRSPELPLPLTTAI